MIPPGEEGAHEQDGVRARLEDRFAAQDREPRLRGTDEYFEDLYNEQSAALAVVDWACLAQWIAGVLSLSPTRLLWPCKPGR